MYDVHKFIYFSHNHITWIFFHSNTHGYASLFFNGLIVFYYVDFSQFVLSSIGRY